MSNHNYSQYSNKKNNKPNVENPFVEAVKVTEVPEAVIPEKAPVEVKMVEETVETVVLPKTVTGVVANCVRLNVREKAISNADIICVLDAGTEVKIDTNSDTAEWLRVCTATGIEGFCMRKFVDVKL